MVRQTEKQKRAEQNLLKTVLGPREMRDTLLSKGDRSAFSLSFSKREKLLLEKKKALIEGIRTEIGKTNRKTRR